MSIDTPLINLMVILSAVLLIGIVIYMINMLPFNKFFKSLFSIIIIIALLVWMVNTFEAFKFIRVWIIHWVVKLRL